MSEFRLQLNRHSPVALYHQLRRILLEQIETGEYQENEQLPSESELAEQYGVSRHVVRQALKGLVSEGRIVAYQGSGYFVNQRHIRKPLPRLGSHTQSMSDLGYATKTLIVSQQKVTPPEFVAERLLSAGQTEAVFIERVSYLDDEPVCMIAAYYPPEFAPVLLNRDLDNRSIYATLKEACNLIPTRAETVISVRFADERHSALLQIAEGAPLLHIGSFTWSEPGKPFEYSSGYYRSDRFELEFEQR